MRRAAATAVGLKNSRDEEEEGWAEDASVGGTRRWSVDGLSVGL